MICNPMKDTVYEICNIIYRIKSIILIFSAVMSVYGSSNSVLKITECAYNGKLSHNNYVVLPMTLVKLKANVAIAAKNNRFPVLRVLLYGDHLHIPIMCLRYLRYLRYSICQTDPSAVVTEFLPSLINCNETSQMESYLALKL